MSGIWIFINGSHFFHRYFSSLSLFLPLRQTGLDALLPGQRDLPRDVPDRPPGLGVEHGEGVVLVLHPHVHEPVPSARGPHCALVQVRRVHEVGSGQAEVVGQVGVRVEEAGAQDDGVDLKRTWKLAFIAMCLSDRLFISKDKHEKKV